MARSLKRANQIVFLIFLSLLTDMLEILRLEQRYFFGDKTLPQLTSAIQRHGERKRRSGKATDGPGLSI
jgi:hypothetical protein